MTEVNTETPERDPNDPDAPTESLPPGFVVWLWKQARRVVVFVIGSTVLLIGIAMVVLPGPAVIVIPLGLAILATEFVWAKDWLSYARRHLENLSVRAAKARHGTHRPRREID
jgi:uncharacterized protein (TIGR02611 family)